MCWIVLASSRCSKMNPELKLSRNYLNVQRKERLSSLPLFCILYRGFLHYPMHSFADTWIAATAIFYDAILVHKDPEFEQLESKLEMLKLPYKKSGKG